VLGSEVLGQARFSVYLHTYTSLCQNHKFANVGDIKMVWNVLAIIFSKHDTGMYSGLAWLITMGSGLGDWIYWHFFTITIIYDSSQSMTVYNTLHSLLDHECLLFHCDEWLLTHWTTLNDVCLDESFLQSESFGRRDICWYRFPDTKQTPTLHLQSHSYDSRALENKMKSVSE
jgi:hypothetical protein